MKILLLNPPADRTLLREYYCSKLSKGNYLSEPIDLVVQSAILSQEHDISVLDCVVDNIKEKEVVEYVQRNNFDAVLFLSGSISYFADFRLIEKIKKMNKRILTVGSGDIFMEEPEKILNDYSSIDAILTDFTSDGLLQLLKGGRAKSIVYRDGSSIRHLKDNGNNKFFTIPVPRHELFPLRKYTYPVIRKRPLATILTEYGCPFRCKFCIMNTLPRKVRRLENIREELIYLRKLGVKELFIIDQTFGVDRKRLLDFCSLMKELKFSWFCFSRIDVMDYEKLKMIKEVNCHTIIFGVESGSQEILDENMKNMNLEKTAETFALCKRLGIRTLATFILGLPGDNYDSCIKTIEFAKSLPCDYVSFNLAIPRMATKMRKEAIERGIISSNLKEMDQTGSNAVSLNESLSIKQLVYLQRKGYLEFYLRLHYLFNRISAMRSFTEMFVHIRDGYHLIYQMMNNFGKKSEGRRD